MEESIISDTAVLGVPIGPRTRRLLIGTEVAMLPHNPLLGADHFAMLDIVSNARLEFGIGQCSGLVEYARVGLSQGHWARVIVETTEPIVRASCESNIRST